MMTIKQMEVTVGQIAEGYVNNEELGVRGYGGRLDTVAMAKRISSLLRDGDIQRPQGIIPYVLTGDERSLDLRAFPEDIKLAVYEEQHHRCAVCGKEFDYEFMEGDHITPWREGGRTVKENCQMLCRECNRRKGAR